MHELPQPPPRTPTAADEYRDVEGCRYDADAIGDDLGGDENGIHGEALVVSVSLVPARLAAVSHPNLRSAETTNGRPWDRHASAIFLAQTARDRLIEAKVCLPGGSPPEMEPASDWSISLRGYRPNSAVVRNEG
jgi:hypothetical protein